MKKIFAIISLLLLFTACGGGSKRGFRVGIDPNWYPVEFGSQQPYVNGFTEELLLEVARYTGIEFEKMTANWDTILDGLKTKKYDAIISSLPPYSYNQAQYDFSPPLLQLGPVWIVPSDHKKAPSKIKGALVGLIEGDATALIVEKYPTLIQRNYSSIPDLLNGVVDGEVQGAILAGIPGARYVRDLYEGKLKIIGKPLDDSGLRFIVLKGEHKHIFNGFNKAIQRMQKKKRLQALLEKWQLRPAV
jgi:polar amino acid transport system substrate-binding protein